MNKLFVAVVLVLAVTIDKSCGLITWRKTTNLNKDEIIEINHEYMKESEAMFNVNNTKYKNLMNYLRNFTVDEKCEMGLDFGIGFQITSPYSNIIYESNGKITSSGIIPHALREMMGYCCPKSKMTFGHHFVSMKDIEQHYADDPEIDFSFPVYGMNGKNSQQFKDFPFIPIVTAPRVVLLVPDRLFKELDSRTQVLLRTIFNTWPMLVFIVVSAMMSGLIVWLLDRKDNSDEFPPTFFSGAWEGVWWAFVTMTTVGYGDRSPKSPYARAFCIMWILLGIVLISLFTGLITAALSVSATPVYKVNGAKIGAVKGSMEFQLAVELNSEAVGYENGLKMLTNLTEDRFLHGALLDNFILSSNAFILNRTKLRIEREYTHPVTYGIAMKKGNSTKTEQCFRKYSRRHPDKLFEIIAKQLKPIKNPTDNIRVEVEAAEELGFYEEKVFKTVVFTECGLLLCAFMAGVFWEFFVRNKDSAAYRMVGRLRGKPKFADQQDYELDQDHQDTINVTNGNSNNNSSGFDHLIEEYNEFHLRWIERVKQMASSPSNHSA